MKKSGAWFLKKYPSYISNIESNCSSPNLSQIEQSSPCLRQKKLRNFNSQNLSVSSSNSSSLRIWKPTKESNLLNTEYDDLSDISNDNDYNNDSNSNYDATSVKNFSTSNENIYSKAIHKENATQQYSPKENNSTNFHNSSFKKQNPSPNQTNEITQLNPPVSNSNLSTQSSNCIANNNSDDEVNSPNMTNYNYYSSIINNLRTDENTNQEATANSKLNESNSNSNMKFKANSFSNISKKFKMNNNETKSKNFETRASNSMSNGTGVNSNSLNYEANLSSPSNCLDSNNNNNNNNNKQDNFKSFKKPKILEWCSSQLSMGIIIFLVF